MNTDVSYLTANTAAEVDVHLMSEQVGYSLAQLMELAGLAVANVIENEYPDRTSRILLCCGSGNNGGDGLVAARHLVFYGYTGVRICYPKPVTRDPFNGLVKQLECLEVPFLSDLEESGPWDVIVDAIFGFSFKVNPDVDPRRAVRAPFDSIIKQINSFQCPVVSIDIPSGWDVEMGNTVGCPSVSSPAVLISLTAPKLCARFFTSGTHFCAGRFVPELVASALQIKLPEYSGSDSFVKLPPVA